MPKLHETYTLYTIIGTTGTSSAFSYGNTEKSRIQVEITGSTGAAAGPTVVISGSVDAASTGTYSIIDTTTSTGTTASYFVDISGNYNWLKAKVTPIGSAGARGTIKIVTQGPGYN